MRPLSLLLLLLLSLSLVVLVGACAEPGTSAQSGAPRSSTQRRDDPARAPSRSADPLPTAPAVNLERHARALAERLPEGFTVVVAPPFVVAGDEPSDVVHRRAESTVRWAVERLRQDFFDAEPSAILDVMLFKDERSYTHHALALYGDTPTTPYGYYSSDHGALIMNISTGGGTLVHEIVHPFVEADFPGCPPWLNEGLGSLFEQSSERHGRIVGETNWRLAGLKRAIRSRRLPRFEELAGMDATTFYERDRGTNYAQARYLLYYLQEQGLLVRFYRAARAAKKGDPSAYGTLRKVLEEPDMAAFQSSWEAWVLGLRYPGR